MPTPASGNEQQRERVKQKAPGIVRSPAFWSRPENKLRIAKAPGRPIRRVSGGWIADLVALNKAINLCQAKCLQKFNMGNHGYYIYPEKTGENYCWSDCDGCREAHVKCNTFLPIKRT